MVPVVLSDLLVIHGLTLGGRDGYLLPKGGELRNTCLVIAVTAMMRNPCPQDLASRHRLSAVGGLLQE
jgi:hypothetical protein